MKLLDSKSEENRLGIVKQHLINLTAHRLFKKTYDTFDEAPVFRKLKDAWRLFYPQKKHRFIVEPVGDNIDAGFELFLEDEANKYRVPADMLSSGEIELLTMLGWFAIKEFSGGILFFDEPELHLHPTWHRAILRALREVLPDTQIICATHSPDVLDAVEYYQRFILLDEIDPRVRLRNSRARSESDGD